MTTFKYSKNKPVNKAQATQLFAENAVLFGRCEGVPEKTAIHILGYDAVKSVKQPKLAGATFNCFDNGKHLASYLTEYGFYLAASYNNVECIHKAEKAGE